MLKMMGKIMVTLSASQARIRLYKLLDKTAIAHEPIQIIGKHHNAILISQEDWQAMQETMFLLSVPGMKKSIRTGLKTPL